MRLQTQLMGLIGVMGALLIAFAAFNAVRDIVYIENSSKIGTVADLSDTLIEAAGSYAIERGTTAGILGAGGEASNRQREALAAARQRADALADAALDLLGAGGGDIQLSDPGAIDRFRAARVELSDYRDRVDAVIAAGTLDRDPGLASQWFPFITHRVIMESAGLRSDAELQIQGELSQRLAEAFVAQEELFLWAEWAGRERGMLNGIIARNELIPFEMLERIYVGVGHIDAAIDLINDRKQSLPPAIQATIDDAIGLRAGIGEVMSASIQASGIMPYPVTSAEWWEQASAAIDRVRDARDLVADELRAAYAAYVDGLWLDLYLMLGLLAFSLGVVIWTFFFVRNRIAKPLQSIIDAQLELAEGNLDVWVPDTKQKNEIGQLSKALYRLKQESRAADRYRREQEAFRVQVEEEQRAMLLKVADDFESSVGGIIEALASSSSELAATSKEVSDIATRTSSNADSVGRVSNAAKSGIGDVVAATEQLNDAIAEVAEKVTETSRQAREAAEVAREAADRVAELNAASAKIRDVTTLISDIAEQTNLLALNATIEAARAGDAGKGFAVVAAEVKNLATQTQKATEEIGGQVDGMLAQIEASVEAVQKIRSAVEASNDTLAAIASAAEEQSASTDGIAQSVTGAADQIADVVRQIVEVNEQSSATSSAAEQMRSSAEELARNGERLGLESGRFLDQIRQGSGANPQAAD